MNSTLLNNDTKVKQKNKHYDVVIKYCTVQIFSAKSNPPSKQTTKIYKTTIKWLWNTWKIIIFQEELFSMSTRRYEFTPI